MSTATSDKRAGRSGSSLLGCVAGLAVTVVALAGCARPVHTQPNGKVSICGTTVSTGAEIDLASRLQPDSPPRPAPSKSLLPAPVVTNGGAGLWYVRLTDSCTTGAVVTVVPPGNAGLGVSFLAADGRPAALGLVVRGPIVVRAWSGGRDLGFFSQG